jgi:23S rRNA (guanosine2251-2'-O)-methyltransferase
MAEREFYIYGKLPVLEALSNNPKAVKRIYLKGDLKQSGFEGLRKLARDNQVPINTTDDRQIKLFLKDEVNHQGVVALHAPFPYTNFDEWIETIDVETNPLVLLLDHVQDVSNLGAIIRTATAVGVSAIIVAELNQAPVTTAVYKTSAGLVGRVPIIQVGNLNQTVDKLKDKKFWISGLIAGGTTYWDHEFTEATVLVVGSEGSGIREKTMERCDFALSVPMDENVESLNVSVATALVAYEWKRQQNL